MTKQRTKKVVAQDILRLHQHLAYEWLPETDKDDTGESTREVYERLLRWAKMTVEMQK